MSRLFLFLLLCLAGTFSRAESFKLSLAGRWQCELDSNDTGVRELWYDGRSFSHEIALPGTLAGAGLGEPCTLQPAVSKPQILHLTARYSYVGPAWYKKDILIPNDWKEKQIILTMERVLWNSMVWIDGKKVEGESDKRTGEFETISTPQKINLTDYLKAGRRHQLVVRIDNRQLYDVSDNNMAHAYTNETQTIWNGILGEIALHAENKTYIKDVQVYPQIKDKRVQIRLVTTNAGKKTTGNLRIYIREKATNELVGQVSRKLKLDSGETVADAMCTFDKPFREWDEFTPVLYNLSVCLETNQNHDEKTVAFGMREISGEGNTLRINGRQTFLRGTLDCCVSPLTGHPAMDKEEWVKEFSVAKQWGLNHLRFHSWCPPEAAFRVADSLGLYLQVELPLWSLKVGKDSLTSRFLYKEALRIVTEFGNHPSFCLFSLGNELQPDFRFLAGLLNYIKGEDSRHLYTTSTFTFEKGHGAWPEKQDEYYVTQWTKKGWVRGQGVFDSEMPAFNKDYSASVDSIAVPLITHEIGQYSVFPNLNEISKYTGLLNPLNLKGIQQELARKGLLSRAGDYLKASGKLAVILYKEEIERALKTTGISGFQLLGLQDFPGQGTALVGLLDAFWDNKGIVDAAYFRQFNNTIVPLLKFPKAVYTNSETFKSEVLLANFSSSQLPAGTLLWTLKDATGYTWKSGSLSFDKLSTGRVALSEHISFPLKRFQKAVQLTLSVVLKGTDIRNSWNIWVYPDQEEVEPRNIIVTATPSEVERALKQGRNVLFIPSYKEIKGLEGKFVPVFWSPVHFPKQAGTMGILCNPSAPVFRDFPTDSHTNWQWWSLLKRSKTLVIDSLSGKVTPLVTVIDNFVNNRRLSNLFETRIGKGKLVVCTMDLLTDMDKRPEARQLYHSILHYMQSDSFVPQSSLEWQEFQNFLDSCL